MLTKPKKSSRPRGRPSHRPTEDLRRKVSAMAVTGLSASRIAAILEISEPTLKRHYSKEMQLALAKANGAVVAALVKNAQNGDIEAADFFLLNHGAYKRRTRIRKLHFDWIDAMI